MTADRLTPEREAEIRARLEAATPGEWTIVLGSGMNLCTGVAAQTDDDAVIVADCLPDYALREGTAPADHRPNMDLIANAPADLTALLRELDLMRADATAALDALRRIGIFRSDEAGDDGSEWCVTLEPRGEEPVGSLDEALARVLSAAQRDAALFVDAAERERDLLAETARRLTGEREVARGKLEWIADRQESVLVWTDLRDDGDRDVYRITYNTEEGAVAAAEGVTFDEALTRAMAGENDLAEDDNDAE